MLTVPGRELCFEAVECRKERDRGRDRAGKDLYAAVSGEKDATTADPIIPHVSLSVCLFQFTNLKGKSTVSKHRFQDFATISLSFYSDVFKDTKNKTTRYINTYTTTKTFGVSTIFNVHNVSYAYQDCIDLIQ